MTGARSFLREADWLTPARVRAYAIMVAIMALVLLGFAYTQAMGKAGSDFLAFWGAGRAVLSGNPAGAYDLALQERLQTATGSEGWFAFVNPPPFLFAATPFALMPFSLAWWAWVGVTWALWAFVAIRMFPRLWLLVIAFPGGLIAATHAQTGLLVSALLMGAVHWLDRRPASSGLAIGALVIKPHFAVLIPFWLAAGRRWRVFGWATVALLSIIAATGLVFGAETLRAYPESWRASEALLKDVNADFQLRMASFYAQARLYLAEPIALLIAAASGVLALIASVLAWRRFGDDARAAGAVLLSATALASPYLFNYDLPFLIVPLLYLVERGLADGFRHYEKLLLVALWLAPYATRAFAFPLGFNAMPVASLALLALVWTRARRGAATAKRN